MALKRLTTLLLVIPLLAACGKLDELNYSPETTPEEWCKMRPCVDMGDTVFNEPLGTFLVYLLMVLWIAAGVVLLRSQKGQKSRLWMGIAMVVGGIGAGLAGTSYQAFSYELKCAGRDLCALTNGFEVGYNLCQAASVSAMLVAAAYALSSGRLRTGLIVYAVANTVVYFAITVVAVTSPSATLLSFSVLMLFAVPGIIVVIVLAGRTYFRGKDALSGSLFWAAILLVLVQVAYFAYYAAGLTKSLYDGGNGFYFSENDVLHVGMLLWLGYILKKVVPVLRDADSEPAAATV